MSRTKHITIDEAELLEAKFEQLEKRVENVERFLFSGQQKRDGENPGMTEMLKLLTTLVDRQIANPVGQTTQGTPMSSNGSTMNKSESGQQKDNENGQRLNTLNMQRLRTII